MKTSHLWTAIISALTGFSIGVVLRTGYSQIMMSDVSVSTSQNIILSPDTCPNVASSRFDQIYKGGGWGAKMQTVQDFYSNAMWPPKARNSASGRGSNLGYGTMASLQILRSAIREHNVKTIIDLPCGDTNWIFDSWETDSLELYIGLDIVKPVIDLNSKRLAFHSNKLFRHWDGAICPLPKFRKDHSLHSVDLVHSRDVLQHLSHPNAIQFLCNVFKHGARLFVTTTFPGGTNKLIKEGSFFHNDLTKSPFDLPNVTDCVPSHPKFEPDLTCVYDLTQAWVPKWIAQKCS